MNPIFLSRNEVCAAMYKLEDYLFVSLRAKQEKSKGRNYDEYPTIAKEKKFGKFARKLDKLGPSTDRTPDMVLISYQDYLELIHDRDGWE